MSGNDQIIIGQSGLRRAIDATKPFMLCLSRTNAEMLIEQIQSRLLAHEDKWSYGWITIYPFRWVDGSPPNTKPLDWLDPGNINPPSF